MSHDNNTTPETVNPDAPVTDDKTDGPINEGSDDVAVEAGEEEPDYAVFRASVPFADGVPGEGVTDE